MKSQTNYGIHADLLSAGNLVGVIKSPFVARDQRELTEDSLAVKSQVEASAVLLGVASLVREGKF